MVSVLIWVFGIRLMMSTIFDRLIEHGRGMFDNFSISIIFHYSRRNTDNRYVFCKSFYNPRLKPQNNTLIIFGYTFNTGYSFQSTFILFKLWAIRPVTQRFFNTYNILFVGLVWIYISGIFRKFLIPYLDRIYLITPLNVVVEDKAER